MAITNILLTAGDQASQPPPRARFGDKFAHALDGSRAV